MKPLIPSDAKARADYAEQLMSNPDECGKAAWSKAAGRYMTPSRCRHINPSSPEGQEIARRLLTNVDATSYSSQS